MSTADSLYKLIKLIRNFEAEANVIAQGLEGEKTVERFRRSLEGLPRPVFKAQDPLAPELEGAVKAGLNSVLLKELEERVSDLESLLVESTNKKKQSVYCCDGKDCPCKRKGQEGRKPAKDGDEKLKSAVSLESLGVVISEMMKSIEEVLPFLKDRKDDD